MAMQARQGQRSTDMLATLAADPIASLVDTAFVGHLGAAQLAGVGTAMSIYNAATKMFNASLLAVTTSQVACATAAAAAASAAAPGSAAAPPPPGGAGDDPVACPSNVDEPTAAKSGEEQQQQQQEQQEWRQQEQQQLAARDLIRSGDQGRPGNWGAAAHPHSAPLGSSASPFAVPARVDADSGSPAPSPGSEDAIILFDDSTSPAPSERGARGSESAPPSGGPLVAVVTAPKHAPLLEKPVVSPKVAAGGAAADDAEGDRGSGHHSGSSGAKGGAGGQELAVAASSALALALAFGVFEAVSIVMGATKAADAWGAPTGSPLRAPTLDFLLVRGMAAPITVLLLVLQGVFRGMHDATTPLYATIACNAINVALESPFIFSPLHMGVRGSALATIIAQALPLAALLVVLRRGYRLAVGPSLVDWAHLGAMFRPTGFLVLRSVCVSAVFAVATGLASRAGPIAAAAHQIALQLWLSSSLLADALAAAVQTLVASEIAAGRLRYARALVRATLTSGCALGLLLGAAVWAGAGALPALFTSDPLVLRALRPLMLVVAATQPVNALAFVLDGVLYGAGGFRYASAMMMPCAGGALALMICGARWSAAQQLPPEAQLVWVWAGLVVLMLLRIVGIGAPLLLQQYPLGCLYRDRREAREARAA
ncbi:hypothetical protein MNEG_10983, partial [Monoraphidium neglectum]